MMTCENAKNKTTRQFLACSLDRIIQEAKRNHRRMGRTSVKLHVAHRDRGILEVLTDGKKYFKVIAGVRLKLEKDIAAALPCIVKEESRRTTQADATSIDASEEQSDSAS